MPTSKFATFVGTAKETTPGTAVAATLFTPVTDASPEDVKNYVPDTAMRGSAVDTYNHVPTQGSGTYGYGGPVFMDTIGVPLKAIFGAEDLSGAGPYVHKFGLKNTGDFQPPTYTISDYNGNNTRQFPFAMCSQIVFTFGADGLLTYTTSWTTFPSATTSKPTQTFSAKTAIAAYKGVLTVGGVASTDIESGTWTISRAVSVITGVNGSSSPIAIYGGAASSTFQYTALYSSTSETRDLAAMLAGTSTSFEASFTNGADILDLKATNGLFTKAPISRGKDYLEITVDGSADGNTTDASTAGTGYSPLSATLTNTTSTAY